jgi:hypothetical protein
MTGNTPYDNQTPQAVRRATLLNDQRASTYVDHVHDDTSGGRFAKVTPSTVTGTGPVPLYPTLPANSPWHHDPVPAEEPLSFDNAAPIVGEVFEVQRSLAEACDGTDLPPSLSEPALPGGAETPVGKSAAERRDRRRRLPKHKTG